MFCPHCHNKIPDGSNICPLCYANLAGVKPQSSGKEEQPQGERAQQAKPRSKKPAYSKGSRGSRRSADRTPMIIAFGLIVILIVIIAMIIRSMFSAGTPGNVGTPEPQVPENTVAGNFFVFGSSPEPEQDEPQEPTPEPPTLEVTPTPAPTTETTYKTLRKGDQGRDVETLQRALAQLGYLSGAQDGNFGTGTETAVKNFQEANGLSADGIAGKMTLEALYRQVSYTPAPQTTVNPGDVLDLPG